MAALRKVLVSLAVVAVYLVAARADAAPDTAPAGGDAARPIALPSTVDAVAVAGSGKFLLLEMKKLSKLAVYDIGAEKITGYVPLPGNDVLVAGGASKLVLVLKDRNIIQRWTLNPLQKDLTVPFAAEGEVDNIALGHASNGPLMVMTRGGPKFYSLDTLKESAIKAEGYGDWHPHPQYPIFAAASADGQTFAGWTRGLSPSGVRVLQVRGNVAAGRYAHDSAGVLLPSWDGSMLYTGSGIYSADLKRIAADQFRGRACVPSLHPSYFLAVQVGDPFGGGGGRNRGNSPTVAVHTSGDRNLLVALDPMPELAPAGEQPFGYQAGNWSERIFLAPTLGKLVTVSDARDKLVSRPFDVLKALDKAGIDYLFVESLPVTRADPGKPYKYALTVKSKRGGVKYALDSGPEGMTISKDGVLTWTPPAGAQYESSGVIVSVEDASGQSLFHTFNVELGTPPQPAAARTPRPGAAQPGRPGGAPATRPATRPARF